MIKDEHKHTGTDMPQVDFKDTLGLYKLVVLKESNSVKAEALTERSTISPAYTTLKSIKVYRAGVIMAKFSIKASGNYNSIKLLSGSTNINEYVIGESPYPNINTWYDVEETFNIREFENIVLQAKRFDPSTTYIKDYSLCWSSYLKTDNDNLIILN